MKLDQPDMIIFRVYGDDPNSRVLASMFLDEDNNLLSDAKLFTVDEDDSYNALTPNQVVLACEGDTSGSSYALCTFALDSIEGGEFIVSHQDYTTLNLIAREMINSYNAS